MFLPILDYDDGYGFTYGGRVSTIGMLGMGERLSVPLTWGGTRRAAIEGDRTFKTGPLSHVVSTFGISQSENPHFEIDDQRVAWTGRAERSFARVVRTGVSTSQSTVDFGELDDRLWTVGADAALDTRGDPGFPRNAVFLSAGWNALHVRRLDEPINQYFDGCPRLSGRDRPGRACRTRAVLVGATERSPTTSACCSAAPATCAASAPALSTAIGCWPPPRSCACR